jgi:hypothetical protein
MSMLLSTLLSIIGFAITVLVLFFRERRAPRRFGQDWFDRMREQEQEGKAGRSGKAEL